MSAPNVSVDDVGIHFTLGFHGTGDLYVAGRRVWSFSVDRPGPAPTTVAWPPALSRRLVGTGRVRVESESGTEFDDVVRFADSDDDLDITDQRGKPIVVDKWGLAQHTFDTRREAGVVDVMVEKAEEMLRVLRESCGIEGWISFGTLLGAAREGGVIGHDSDIDLCYLSEQPTPSAMARELWTIGRALRAAGLRVQYKSGSFLTVMFAAPDGVRASIDLYTTFFVGDLLHETATVRAPVPRSAVLPLTTIEFEGRRLPAPADVDALLTVSYGPGWRVPDPSFAHQPGREITRRFDGWFGSLMRGRRDWRRINTRLVKEEAPASSFADFVADQLPAGTALVDVGAGAGADLDRYRERGLEPVGFDYAQPRARRRGDAVVKVHQMNLYDLRDVLTSGAIMARAVRPGAVCAREVLETLDADGRAGFWTFTSMSLRGGGRLFLEGRAWSPDAARARVEDDQGPARPLDPALLLDEVGRTGGLVVHREGVVEAGRSLLGGRPTRWRIVAEYPERASAVAS